MTLTLAFLFNIRAYNFTFLNLDNFYLDNTSIFYNEPSSKTQKLNESRIRSINLYHCRFILECFLIFMKINNHVLIDNSLFFVSFLPEF